VTPDGQNIMTITIKSKNGGSFHISKFNTIAAALKAFAGSNTFPCATCGCRFSSHYHRVQHRQNMVDPEHTRDASINLQSLLRRLTEEQKNNSKDAWMSTCLARLNSSTNNSSSISFDSRLPNLMTQEK